MRELTIYQRYFYNSDCYKQAPQQECHGVQVHSTGANNPWLKRYVQPDDGRLGKNTNDNDHNRPGRDVCASFYIGKQADGTVAVYQSLPFGKRCWLSGSGSRGNANRLGYIGFEICEDGLDDEKYFHEAVLNASVNLTAYICNKYNLDIGMVRDHSELHNDGLASDHGDITHWLKKFGFNMGDYRRAVLSAMNEGVHAVFVDCDKQDALYEATITSTGTYLNLRETANSGANVIERMPRGRLVSVLDDTDPLWWRVSYNGETGYAMAWKDENHTVQWITPNRTEPVPVEAEEESDDGNEDMIAVLEAQIEECERRLNAMKQILLVLKKGK